jgi:hypothetical protein
MTASDEPDKKLNPARSAVVADAKRRLLPNDLGLALKYASGDELEKLRDAVQKEMKRRNHPQKTEPLSAYKPGTGKADSPAHDLTRSQVSLVRSSIEAGVKPSVLSKQFGISLAAIRAVLAEQ